MKNRFFKQVTLYIFNSVNYFLNEKESETPIFVPDSFPTISQVRMIKNKHTK
ncbi:Uncharacterised protein [Staphylococcus saprophyticus]|nr:Uncharacterised protein [Staphylococcus saprophyticus]